MIKKIGAVSSTLVCLLSINTSFAMNIDSEDAKFITDVIESKDQNRIDQLLHIYSSFGKIEFVEELVKRGVNINGSISDILKNLIGNEGNRQIGVTTNGYTGGIGADHEKCFTPLHWAAAYGHPNVVEFLLKAKASIDGGINNPDEVSLTPLQWALTCKEEAEKPNSLISNRKEDYSRIVELLETAKK